MSRQPWQRRPDETDKAFAAFEKYRDLPKDQRTLAGAGRLVYGPRGVQKNGMVVGRIREWAENNEWIERARAHDEHLDALKLEAQAKEASEMGMRHAREAQLIEAALLAPARALAERIQGQTHVQELFREMTIEELARLADRAGRGHALVARFERLSRGLADGKVEVTGPGGGPIEMTIDAAKEALAPILGVEPDHVVDEMAERRKAARAREREANKDNGAETG